MEEDKQEYLSRLENQIERYERHHNQSFDRIKVWYLGDWETRQEYADILAERGLKTDTWTLENLQPPHEIFAERAANFVRVGIAVEQTNEPKADNEVTSNEVGEILVGTGIEMLVKGIVLKDRPKYFLGNSNKHEFIKFKKCKSCLLGVLDEILPEEEKRYCQLGLKIAWDYRNNTIHSGYHRHRSITHLYTIYHVAGFLFESFFGDHSKVIDRLSIRREELNQMLSREHPIIELK